MTTATETDDCRASSCTGRSCCSDFSSPKYDRVCQTCGAAIYQGVMCAACWARAAFPRHFSNPNTGSHRPSEPEANEGSVGRFVGETIGG